MPLAGVCQSSRLLAEVELLEFLLRLAEVFPISVDSSLPFPLAPVLWEKSVEAVGGESVALRYSASLSDVLVAGASSVAAAQLAPIASFADVKSPNRVRVIPPVVSSSFFWVLGLLLGLLEPVGDLLSLLLLCRLPNLPDEGVLVGVCCASTSDLSVMSSNLRAVCVSPC